MRFFLTALVLSSFAAARAGSAADAEMPNIIFILADDLGWGDLGCYGHPQTQTPNLDRLAREGTLFTQFYVNGSVCSPSRCAFFTGQYPARHRIHGHYATSEQNAARGMSQFLDPKTPNTAALLKSIGYATAHVGKWHLGSNSGGPMPDHYGFDFVGSTERGGAEGPADDPHYRAKSTELFVNESLRFIESHRNQPFYLQLWTLVPHATLSPTSEQLARYAQLHPGGPNFPHASAAEIFSASVTDLDTQIGRLLKGLADLGIAEKTLILFSSDNGPEDIHIRNAGHSGVGSAGPFRGRKRSLYEGGVRVPFIVRWPGHVPSGRIDDTSVVAACDFLPTLCKLAGASVPSDHVLDGEDIGDILTGQSRARRTSLMWNWRFRIAGEVYHHSPMLAIREGDYKLLLNPDKSRVELYDIPRDPTQLSNVAEKHPEFVQRLSEKVLAWHKTLPEGPTDPGAGQMTYPYPGKAKAPAAPARAGAKGKAKAAK
jgi:arylsulfatase A-like enzyme